jgi:hypothetical protein
LAERLANVTVIDHPKDVDKDLDICKDILFDFVFMNPSTMAELKVNIGTYVVIEQNGVSLCTGLCWPHAQIPLDRVAMNKHYSQSSQIDPCLPTSLCRNPNAVRVISRITLNMLNSRIDGNAADAFYLTNYLKQTYLNKCILNKRPVYCTFMGQKFYFAVAEIECTASQDLSEAFNTISLSDSSLYRIVVDTEFVVGQSSRNVPENAEHSPDLNFESIGGLVNEIELIKELFIYPFQYFDLYKNIGIDEGLGGPTCCC